MVFAIIAVVGGYFAKEYFKDRFPNIYKNLNELGYDLPFERVPITPAFHYSMGGIEVDLNSKVLNSKNLYAIGEVACIGVHGANRLASNSLLEGLVFAKLAIKDTLKNIQHCLLLLLMVHLTVYLLILHTRLYLQISHHKYLE